MQRSLYKTLRKIGETNQVIYTTHSPHFVSVPNYRDVLLVRRNEEGTYVVQSSLAADNKRREKFLKELDPERNEFFFAKRLLLVEGDSEKLAFPEYGRWIGIDLDRAGATIVEASVISRTSLNLLSHFRSRLASSMTKTLPSSKKAERRRQSTTRYWIHWRMRRTTFASGALRTNSRMWSALRLARRIISGSLKNTPAFLSQRASGSSRQTPRCPFQRSSKRSLLGSHRRQRPKKTSNRLCWPKSSLASVNKARLSWRVIGSASAQLRIRRHAACQALSISRCLRNAVL
jgi:OLD-like protein